MQNIIGIALLIVTIIGRIYLPYIPEQYRTLVIIGITIFGFIFIVILAIWLFKRIKNATKKVIFEVTKSAVINAILNYSYVPNEGIICKGNIRNVIIRVESLIHILGNLTKDCGKEILRKVGEIVGKSFAYDFHEELIRIRGSQLSLRDKLQLWAEYDGTAGWGKYDFSKFYENRTGEIRIRNSWLSSKQNIYEPLCAFMEGYMEVILEEAFNLRCKISSSPTCQRQSVHTLCIFNVSPRT